MPRGVTSGVVSGFGDQEGVNAFDEVPKVGPFEIQLVPKYETVSQILQVPEDISISFTLDDNRVVFTLPELHLHAAFEIRYPL